ncbi:MAG TPA: right-handed parallel beta-helix repeat-containing protein [Bryobacteraceae bacterium]|nr:right-handed parallel beta-helix repeat-containing protein [Bryobacteraceae bacterium]
MKTFVRGRGADCQSARRLPACITRRFGGVFYAAALLSAATAFAQPSQINMSHDLTTLGISNQNLSSNNPGFDARPLFQSAIRYATRNGVPLITADPGVYYFLTPQASDRYLNLNAVKNLTIDLQGSDLYLKSAYFPAFVLVDCQNVTLTNFTVDLEQLPFTQLNLTGVSGNKRTISYSTLPGWPDATVFNNVPVPSGETPQIGATVFRNGQVVAASNRMTITGPIQSGTLQVTKDDSPWTQPNVLSTFQPGDTIVVTARAGEAVINVAGGDTVTISNIDVYASGAIAVHLDTTQNSVVDSVRVMPRAGTDRLVSSNADGIHLSFTLGNNRVRYCFVRRTGDDAIAINSPFLAFVDQQSASRQIVADRNFSAIFPNGLPVAFVSTSTGAILGNAHIVSQSPAYSDPAAAGPVTLNFDQDLPALQPGFGMIYGDPGSRGAGSVIENNLIEDVYTARGIYLGGVAGVTVQRNVIRGTDCGAIVAHEDLDSFPVGPVQDIQILGNSIGEAIGPSAVGTGAIAALATIFVLTTDDSFNFVSSSPNTNVTIANNYLVNSGRAGIWIENVSGASVQGNTDLVYGRYPGLAVWGVSSGVAAQLQQDFGLATVVRTSSGVVMQGNTP